MFFILMVSLIYPLYCLALISTHNNISANKLNASLTVLVLILSAITLNKSRWAKNRLYIIQSIIGTTILISSHLFLFHSNNQILLLAFPAIAAFTNLMLLSYRTAVVTTYTISYIFYIFLEYNFEVSSGYHDSIRITFLTSCYVIAILLSYQRIKQLEQYFLKILKTKNAQQKANNDNIKSHRKSENKIINYQNSILNEIASSSMHEINNPLTVVISNIKKALRHLSRNGYSEKEMEHYLGKAVDNAERIGNIFHNLSHFTIEKVNDTNIGFLENLYIFTIMLTGKYHIPVQLLENNKIDVSNDNKSKLILAISGLIIETVREVLGQECSNIIIQSEVNCIQVSFDSKKKVTQENVKRLNAYEVLQRLNVNIFINNSDCIQISFK